MRRIEALGSTLLLAMIAACGGSNAAVRAPEIQPTERMLEHALPSGIVETTLAMGTNGEGGSASTSLLWLVASDTREYVYAIATCHEARQLDADGDNLAVAECDGQRYFVRRYDDRLQLRRDGEMRASFTVPSGWRVRARSASP